MSDRDNEAELKRLLRADDKSLNHHVEQLAAIVMLALLAACLYASTHVPQIEQAHQWVRDFLN